MKDIGFNVETRFQRKNYYRHLILDYLYAERVITGTGKRLKLNERAGYLQKRMGSTKAYVTNYIEAEAEVMAQMYYDMERAKLIRYIERSNLNIIKALKRYAKSSNDHLMEGVYEAEKKLPNAPKDKEGNPVSMTQQVVIRMNSRIAMSFSQLSGIAQNNGLWTGEKGEYEDIADYLADDFGVEDEEGRLFTYLAALARNEDAAGCVQARTILKYVSLKRKLYKDVLEQRLPDVGIQSEGYGKWQARPSPSFYVTYSLERVTEEILSGIVESYGVTKDDLQKVFVLGRAHRYGASTK